MKIEALLDHSSLSFGIYCKILHILQSLNSFLATKREIWPMIACRQFRDVPREGFELLFLVEILEPPRVLSKVKHRLHS